MKFLGKPTSIPSGRKIDYEKNMIIPVQEEKRRIETNFSLLKLEIKENRLLFSQS